MSHTGSLDKNILVISDLHLGEDLKPTVGKLTYLRHLARLERELESFLAHYTCQRLDGRPWRLVVNGDMVDFMSILVMPVQGGAPSTAEEREYGLGHGEAQSAAKLERVLVRHSGVFQRLAEFVAAGNELVVVVGNHDVEFYYPAVQRTFVEGLLAMAAPTVDADAFRSGVVFCPWFYYEDQLVYVEHGHQYDEYCSFDYQLHPVEKVQGVTLSIAHAGMRYFSNLVPTMDPHAGEQWGFVSYIRWAYAHGARGVARLGYLYGLMVWKMIEIWSMLTDGNRDRERAAAHRVALGEMSRMYRITVEKLEAIDRLRCVPVLKRFARILSAMFLDRVLLVLGGAALLGVAFGLTHGLWRVGAAVSVLGLGVLSNWLLGRLRLLPSPAALRRAPDAIMRILRARYIVFGHSHTAEKIPLANGGTYFNTGTWADERAALPHLLIRRGDVPEAELRQWRDGASTPYDCV